jgi:hypothetical protein
MTLNWVREQKSCPNELKLALLANKCKIKYEEEPSNAKDL